jgi:CHAT domain-containing protein
LALWAPLEKAIDTERVLVVPDGILFNLNFEILTPKKLTSYAEMASGSLLGKHSFSYHYSTLLFSYPVQDQAYTSNFAAFAPGFFDEMKDSYLSQVRDSLQIDRSYLRLIPQPFTDRLVTSLKGLFGGKVFTKEASTLDQFNREAGQHRILHIGTHAESDNISPDFSRLIFAKEPEHPEDENSLFAKDIYQLDLRSELAVLMACETGKPTFSPGEGMISLAHAFNYAGSKSLLTGIWKIDEQASTEIAESFYRYLADGKTKDKALQLAKLDYLSVAEGRSLSPEFWAGLIVMGDASPVDFDPVLGLGHWLLMGFGIIGFGVLLLWFFRSKKRNALE